MLMPSNKTRIVCTIGPASDNAATLDAMLRAGMNVARLNFSHGDFDSHARTIKNLREASARTKLRVAIMADLPGPKMRIGEMEQEPIELHEGDKLTLTTRDIVGNREYVSVTLKELPDIVQPEDKLFLNDGLISLRVDSIDNTDVLCEVRSGGELRARKGLNLPGIEFSMGVFTTRDKECLEFAASQKLDAISQSFVSSEKDIQQVRQACTELDFNPFIIAKIERSNALDNLDGILQQADGLMVARGDLGVETPISRMAVIQKTIMRKANRAAKPVITATQMLESMTTNRRPTRAEATDVANAILDGTDAVMLSGESAMGKYPVDAVQMLAQIATDTEPSRQPNERDQRMRDDTCVTDLIAHSLQMAIQRLHPVAVIIPTRTGSMARNVARFRPKTWITAFSCREQTCQNLMFSYGVFPVVVKEEFQDWDPFTREWLKKQNRTAGLAVLTQGPSPEHPETSHRMEVLNLNVFKTDG
ncbi:MAG: pyruvate kinase [Gammaproteobacteria bacterium]|nr:pyruvate kinase [Gammaproteobacteria bacterium]